MPKSGQHKHDYHDHRLMPAAGHNNPRKSTAITTGTYKSRKRYAKQYREHVDPGKLPQFSPAHWDPDTRDYMTHEAASRIRELDRATRSGSDSNADAGTRGY